LLGLLLAGPLPAQEENEPRTVELVVDPAPEPVPALRYSLMLGFLERKPGNAAVFYHKAGLQIREPSRQKDVEKAEQFLDVPGEELDLGKLEAALTPFEIVFTALELASRRETCDWQLPLREQNPITMLLPEVQQAREFARLLVLRARVQIARGRVNEALETLRIGYTLGRHVAEGPTLVNALVGMAVCGMMSEELVGLIQLPGAPNLYWALTELPRPLISLREAADVEMHILYLMWPELEDLVTEERSLAYWQAFLDDLPDRLAPWEMREYGWQNAWQARLTITALAIKAYPMARQALIDEGRTAEEVDKLPVPQVVLRHTIRVFEEYRDDTFKWFALPYHEAREGMNRAEDRLRSEATRREAIPLASLFLPAVSAAKRAEARTDRTIALLRTVEAIRMYGANHDRRLPESLEEITVVPVPKDPMTGNAFVYRLERDKAILEAPAPVGEPSNRRWAMCYEIRFAAPADGAADKTR
jgi:hypothetical protein